MKNVELRCQNLLLDFPETETFDFIIAQGFLFLGAPASYAERLMQICGKCLSPSGLAYISFNTLPGWHIKRISRDMMRFHSRDAGSGAERIARAREIMAIAAANPPGQSSPYSTAVGQIAASLSYFQDWFLTHDDLAPFNDAVYFEDFIRHSQAHQLRYLGGARPFMDLFQQMPAALQAKLRTFTSDPVLLEQYADFIWGIQYRDAVLCRSDCPAKGKIGAQAVQEMFIAARLQEQPFAADKQRPGDARFWHPHKKREIVANEPGLIAMLRLLAKSWPRRSVDCRILDAAELLVAARGPSAASSTKASLADLVLSSYRAEIIELWTRPTDFIAMSPTRPRVTPLARAQAQSGGAIVNLRHGEFGLSEPQALKLLPLMDGTRDRAALLAELATPAQGASKEQVLDGILSTLSNASLLMSE